MSTIIKPLVFIGCAIVGGLILGQGIQAMNTPPTPERILSRAERVSRTQANELKEQAERDWERRVKEQVAFMDDIQWEQQMKRCTLATREAAAGMDASEWLTLCAKMKKVKREIDLRAKLESFGNFLNSF